MRICLLVACAALACLLGADSENPADADLQVRLRHLNVRQEDPAGIGEKVKQVNEAVKQLDDIVAQANTTVQIIGKLANFATKLGPAIGIFGAVFSIVAAFLPKEEDAVLKEIKLQFGKTFQRLDDLDRKIDYVMGHVEKISVYQDYKGNRDGYLTLEGRYKDFLRAPEKITEKDFINACEDRSPTDLIKWIHQRVVKPLIQPHLLPTILTGSKYSMKELKYWAALIVSDVTQLSLLQASCLGIRKASQSVIDMKAEDTKKFLLEITQTFVEFEAKLKEAWQDQLLKDMQDTLSSYRGRSHAEFARALQSQLDTKYDWNYFGVTAYDDVKGYQVHTVNCYTCKWVWRKDGRNVVVYWSELKYLEGSSKPATAKVKSALKKLSNEDRKIKNDRRSYKAEEVNKYLKDDYLKQQGVAAWKGWTTVLVVNDGIGISSSFHSECAVSHRLRYHYLTVCDKREVNKRWGRCRKKAHVYYNVIVAT